MQKIYLMLGEEQRGPFSEEEVREMYASGVITATTLHWKEDMSDWQVLGPKNWEKSEPMPVRTTIAPPRRSQGPEGTGSYRIERKPLDRGEKDADADSLSARTKPVTLVKGLGILILFFLVLTIVIEIFGHMIPDSSKRFETAVQNAMHKP